MVWVLLCVALCNVGLGFYLGTMLLLPSDTHVLAASASAAVEQKAALLMEGGESSDHRSSSKSSQGTFVTAAANVVAASSSKTWNSTCTDIRQEIATLNDRIRYSFTANDKQLARKIAAELQSRIPLWQKLLEDKLIALCAELEGDPAANVDCVAPELCLAQTETLQTNLALLDWSDSTESILKKLERETEAVKHLLPANC